MQIIHNKKHKSKLDIQRIIEFQKISLIVYMETHSSKEPSIITYKSLEQKHPSINSI